MMTSTPSHRFAVPALALAATLALTGCGGGSADTASTGGSSSSGHGAGHSTDAGSAKGGEADIAFLTGMRPHHEQAVEMSDIVLAADPPADVAALARRIKGAQAPEIEQMDRMLDQLRHQGDGGHGGGHAAAHGGMMSEQEMAALRAATGTEAARLYLEAMIEHHEGAIEASDAQLTAGRHAPALALAEQIRRVQAAEITEMRGLLARL